MHVWEKRKNNGGWEVSVNVHVCVCLWKVGIGGWRSVAGLVWGKINVSLHMCVWGCVCLSV